MTFILLLLPLVNTNVQSAALPSPINNSNRSHNHTGARSKDLNYWYVTDRDAVTVVKAKALVNNNKCAP